MALCPFLSGVSLAVADRMGEYTPHQYPSKLNMSEVPVTGSWSTFCSTWPPGRLCKALPVQVTSLNHFSGLGSLDTFLCNMAGEPGTSAEVDQVL